MHPLVIVNPASGGRRGATVRRQVASLAPSILDNAEIVRSAGPGDARRLAAEHARAGRLLVACGGDGTVSEVASGILDAKIDAALGVLPAGTGNDFARTLQIPRSAAAALRVLADGRTQRIDAGRVRFATRAGVQAATWFINSASFGLSGEVAALVGTRATRLGGTVAFALTTAQVARRFRAPRLRLRVDDVVMEGPMLQVTLANGRYFGGGMRVAPHAALTDGVVDVVLIRPASFLRVLSQGVRLYTGTHLGLPEVSVIRARRVEAVSADPARLVAIEVDGETPGYLPAIFEIHPALLSVCVPRAWQEGARF